MSQRARSAVEVRITGHVQGVWYRNSTSEQAQRLNVCGWVRNESDGSVAGHFEGDPDAIQDLLTWCESGPPAARVTTVAATEGTDEGFESFEIV